MRLTKKAREELRQVLADAEAAQQDVLPGAGLDRLNAAIDRLAHFLATH